MTRYSKIFNISLFIREMQGKIIMRCHSTFVWMVIIRKSTNKKCWWECVKNRTLVHCWWECEQWSHYGEQHGVSLINKKTELPYDLAMSLRGTYLNETKNSKPKRSMHSDLHGNIVYNSQNMEPTMEPFIH